MVLLQEIVTAARVIRAEHKIDKKQALTGVLYCKRVTQKEAIQRLANVTLEVINGPSPILGGAVRSSPDFDLLLNIPVVAEQKERLLKENEQYEKQIKSLTEQLDNVEFMQKAPLKVSSAMLAKKLEYEARLAKNQAALGGE